MLNTWDQNRSGIPHHNSDFWCLDKQGRIHGHQLRTGGQGQKCAFSHFSTRAWRTNRRTDGPTDRRTDKASYRVACPQLKKRHRKGVTKRHVNAHTATGRDIKQRKRPRHGKSRKQKHSPKVAENRQRNDTKTKGQKEREREIETETRRACKRKRNEWAD